VLRKASGVSGYRGGAVGGKRRYICGSFTVVRGVGVGVGVGVGIVLGHSVRRHRVWGGSGGGVERGVLPKGFRSLPPGAGIVAHVSAGGDTIGGVRVDVNGIPIVVFTTGLVVTTGLWLWWRPMDFRTT
jgi:hypothetical protein